MPQTFQYYRHVWTKFIQSIIIRKVVNVSFSNKHNEIVNKNIEYEKNKIRTLRHPS